MHSSLLVLLNMGRVGWAQTTSDELTQLLTTLQQEQAGGDQQKEAAIAALQSEARQHWAQVEEIARVGGEAGKKALKAFIQHYKGASVMVESQSHPVVIREVARAELWLERYDRRVPESAWFSFGPGRTYYRIHGTPADQAVLSAPFPLDMALPGDIVEVYPNHCSHFSYHTCKLGSSEGGDTTYRVQCDRDKEGNMEAFSVLLSFEPDMGDWSIGDDSSGSNGSWSIFTCFDTSGSPAGEGGTLEEVR